MQSENNSIESKCVLVVKKQEDSCLWFQNMQTWENSYIESTCVLVVKKQDDSCLWHKKFGHLNYPILYEYSSDG
jgi:hypothetical protein